MRVPAHPGLYSADPDVPVLWGSRCTSCGRIAFPPVAIGCDACGAADAPRHTRLAASGVIHSLVTVPTRPGRSGQPEGPFTVAEIRLDDGPLVRAMLAPEAEGLSIGAAVTARWHVTKVNDDGDEVVEPAFAGTGA